MAAMSRWSALLFGLCLAVTTSVPAEEPAGISLRQSSSVKEGQADEQLVGEWSGTNFTWLPVGGGSAPQARLQATIPAGHRYVTAVIDDDRGQRVRNLLSMEPAENLGADLASAQLQNIAFAWNGRDDSGKEVSAGNYRLRGLSLPGLKVVLDYSWYNPGMPPWEGYPTSGWGADHACLSAVACASAGVENAWHTVLSGPGGESGHAIWALNAEGRKVWGFKRHWSGANAVAIAGDELWLAMTEPKVLMKLHLGTGEVAGFQRTAGTIGEIKFDQDLKALAVGPDHAAVLLSPSNQIVLLDRKTGRRKAEATLESTGIALTADPRGGFIVSTEKGLLTFDAAGEVISLSRPEVQSPGAIACDARGQFYAVDLGADRQVKVFSSAGQLIRSIGEKGGQRGLTYNPLAFRDPQSIAIDAQDRVWVVEPTHPRRVSLWSSDGRFVRDYVGNTQYGAAHCTLHEQEPTQANLFNTLFRVNPAKVSDYRIERFLSSGLSADSPFKAPGPQFFFARSTLFRSAASGQIREYLVDMQTGFPVLYLAKNGDYRPVLAVASARLCAAFPAVDNNADTISLWCDLNEDERLQPDEFQTLGNKALPITAFYGWTQPMTTSLEFFVQGRALKPVRFTSSGAPIYMVAKAPALEIRESLIRVGEHLVGVRSTGVYAVGQYIFADMQGRQVASYPGNWMGLHASLQSPVPNAGQTCGELFWSGTANVGGEIGSVAVAHGNYGQAFVFTEDGLFLSSLFQDIRQKHADFGDRLARGLNWTNASMGQEAFGGWFGKQDDGKVRYMFGRNAALVCEIQGWDDVRRFDSGLFQFDPAGPSTRPTSQVSQPILRVARRATDRVVEVDGKLREWSGIPRQTIRSGDEVVAQISLQYDDKHLYVAARVIDGSPPRNAATENALAFKAGAAIDLCWGPEQPQRDQASEGDARLLLVPTKSSPTAVLFRPVVAGTPADARVRFASPVREVWFDDVSAIDGAKIAFHPEQDGYACEASLPLEQLGLRLEPDLKLRGDLGVLSANEAGELTTRRSYLFGTTNTIVSDTTSEAEFHPQLWGNWICD